MRPSRAETSEPAWTKRKMLSMKRSTSWPSSRKYSAIVSPERPTRRRAPGGSFICPKTSAPLSRTPDSSLPRHRSLPSRVRSPTPAKTETPPCCSATLWISSWISTVLPSPAPPERPTLRAGPRDEACVAAAHERRDQVDDLDPGLEDLGLRRELAELRRVAVDRPPLG